MRTLCTYKADSIVSTEEVEDRRIEFTQDIKNLTRELTLEKVQSLFEEEAQEIVTVLNEVLPQGIRYKLALLLMKRICDDNLYIGK